MAQYTYTATDKPTSNKPTIDEIGIRWLADDSPDLSHLEKEPTEEYYKEDRERLDAYRRGDWEMTGVQAYARVSYPINDNGDRRLENFTSGGLWGIESDSDKAYKRHEEICQLRELKEHLETFGVDTSDFWTLANVTVKDMWQYEREVYACVKPTPTIEWGGNRQRG